MEFIEWFNANIRLIEGFGSFHFLIASIFMFVFGMFVGAGISNK